MSLPFTVKPYSRGTAKGQTMVVTIPKSVREKLCLHLDDIITLEVIAVNGKNLTKEEITI